jgi:hypothetical protein
MIERPLRITLVVLCFLGAAFAAGQKTGSLKGKVEDEKGKPIVGAQVRAMRSRDRSVKETSTDQSGGYSFELEPDDYVVSFDAEGFEGGTLTRMQQVEEGKQATVKTIRLQKAKRTSLIRGAVFDTSGLSLSGVRLKLVRIQTVEEEKERKRIDSLTRDYTTNSRGEFAFRLPSIRARYRVTAVRDGFKTETKTVEVSEGESVPLAFSLEPVKK